MGTIYTLNSPLNPYFDVYISSYPKGAQVACYSYYGESYDFYSSGFCAIYSAPFTFFYNQSASGISSKAPGTLFTWNGVQGYRGFKFDDKYAVLVGTGGKVEKSDWKVDYYNSPNESLTFVTALGGRLVRDDAPITYRLTNCSAPNAPQYAVIGDTVNVSFTFPDGYGFPNPATDVYVYNNGVLVPSSYANNVLTFTMPDSL